MYYSGIDLHKDNCYITTVNDTGTIVKQERVATTKEAISAHFGRLRDNRSRPSSSPPAGGTGWMTSSRHWTSN